MQETVKTPEINVSRFILSMPETAVMPLEEVLDLGIEIADPLAAMCAEWNRFYGWSALKNAVLSLN
jgi:hypothetical protein